MAPFIGHLIFPTIITTDQMKIPSQKDLQQSSKLFRNIHFAPHVDPLAIIEASLTSMKYAFYQSVGYALFYFLGHEDPVTTLLSAAVGGFIGGAVFTIPYLIILLRTPETAAAAAVAGGVEDLGSFGTQVWLLGSETLYSGIAGGVGVVVVGTMDGWGREDVVMGILRGIGGPLVSFSLLFLSLTVAWVVVKSRSNLAKP